MTGDNDKVFPLMDRRAPLLERIRGEGEDGDFGEQAAITLADFIQNDDPGAEASEMERLSQSFLTSLADELDADETEISDEVVERFMDLLAYNDEEKVLSSEVSSLGTEDDDSDDEDEESDEDEDGPSFTPSED